MTIDDVLNAVRAFVSARGGDGTSILSHTRLLGEGHVDSFALIELIASLERALDISLPDGALIPEDFETVATLHDRLTVVRQGATAG